MEHSVKGRDLDGLRTREGLESEGCVTKGGMAQGTQRTRKIILEHWEKGEVERGDGGRSEKDALKVVTVQRTYRGSIQRKKLILAVLNHKIRGGRSSRIDREEDEQKGKESMTGGRGDAYISVHTRG